MKKKAGCIVVIVLLLPSLGIGKHKEDTTDPRLKQIHSIFLQGSFTAIQYVQDNQAEIEKGSCLKVVKDADTADAVVKVSYTPGGVSQETAGQIGPPGMSIQQRRPYHTGLELSVREGSKMKKIWEKHVDLTLGAQESQPGVSRLMDLLRQDACGAK